MKHAYCILAHNNFKQVQILLNLLDDYRNDIFLHIDTKAQIEIRLLTQKSNLYIYQKYDVRWSDISQLDTEVFLFKEVLKTNIYYDRIHLISGSDLPVKSQDYIHKFFENKNEEFIDIQTNTSFMIRMKYYHFFVRKRRINLFYEYLRKILLIPQVPLINRMKYNPLPYAYGANWCSLTQNAIEEITKKISQYRKFFLFTTSPDEHYKQMILLNAKQFTFAKEKSLRYVDFSQRKSSPKILSIEDYEKIRNSKCLFARKFDMKIDMLIIQEIINNINKNNS